MFCCSIVAVILSQLYAGLISLRALLFGGEPVVQAERGGTAVALFRTVTTFSSGRLAIALLTGAFALAIALAVGSTPLARDKAWVPMATAFCGKPLS